MLGLKPISIILTFVWISSQEWFSNGGPCAISCDIHQKKKSVSQNCFFFSLSVVFLNGLHNLYSLRYNLTTIAHNKTMNNHIDWLTIENKIQNV